MTSTPSASAARRAGCTRFGKDHLTLADWPIGVATYQQRRQENGAQRDFAAFNIERPDGTRQKVTLESPSRIGLPTAGDKDVLIALLLLAKEQEFSSDVVRFVPWQLLQIMGWSLNQKSLRRLKTSLKRLKALTATYENAWYSRRTRKIEACLVTGILAEAKILFRRGRRASNIVPESYVQWTRHVYTSLQEGSLIDLDLDLYFSCKRPGAKDLLRHLNKVWHGGRKPKPYARDLKELACGHLGLTDSKDLKRNFHQLVKELESCNYVRQADSGARYQRIRPGIWRVHLELHPDQLRTKRPASAAHSSREKAAGSPEFAAARLVRLYHQHRFGKADYVPRQHEISRANQLLQEHDANAMTALAPSVARAVECQYRGKDVYFGSAVPYFVRAAERREKQQRLRHQLATKEQQDVAGDAAIMEQKRKRRLRRERLLGQWARLSHNEHLKFLQLAIDNARSDFDRRRLSRLRVDDEPPREALEEMDRHRSLSRLASNPSAATATRETRV